MNLYHNTSSGVQPRPFLFIKDLYRHVVLSDTDNFYKRGAPAAKMQFTLYIQFYISLNRNRLQVLLIILKKWQ